MCAIEHQIRPRGDGLTRDRPHLSIFSCESAMSKTREFAPDFVSADTLAYLLDISVASVYAWAKSGIIPKPYHLGAAGGTPRWSRQEVADYIVEKGKTQENGEPFFNIEALRGQTKNRRRQPA